MIQTLVEQESYYNDHYDHSQREPLVEKAKQTARLSTLRRLLGTRCFSRVLVVGCGRGPDVTIPEAKTVVALDLSRAGVRLARTRYPVARYLQADGIRLPFLSGVFDAVICSEVIEHVINPNLLVSEIARVLRGGGYLAMSTPNWVSWWGLCRKLGDLIGLEVSYQPVDRWFTPRRLQTLLSGSFAIRHWRGIWYLPPTRVGSFGLPDRKLGRFFHVFGKVDRSLGCIFPKIGHMVGVLATPLANPTPSRQPRPPCD